ncbi:energy transducer TonB [Hyphomonas sp.]|uniref:energy transducer TonB n=1 Tax=Hyphomonas sp. TaxID=87 RepID=UPI00391DBD4C
MRLTLDAAPSRLSLSVLLAVPLVYALFLAASLLIKVDELVMTQAPARALTTITPEDYTPLTPETVKPPPTLTLIDRPTAIERPRIDTLGEAPLTVFEAPPSDVFTIGKITPPTVAISEIVGRNGIAVVRPPMPSMPAAALTRGISGSCDVMFDVDARGRPFNLTAQCTDSVFKAEAIRAVSKAEFLPKVKNGVAVEQRGAIYPIEFEVK